MRYTKCLLVMLVGLLLLGMGSCEKEKDGNSIAKADILGLWRVDLDSKQIEDKKLGLSRVWVGVMPLQYLRFSPQRVVGYTHIPPNAEGASRSRLGGAPEEYDYALEGDVLLVKVLGVWQAWGKVRLQGRTMTLENGKEAVQAQCIKQELGEVAAKGVVAVVTGTNTMRLDRVGE